MKLIRRAQLQLLPQPLWGTSTELIKDVIVPLLRALATDPRLLQQVMRNVATDNCVFLREVNLNELSES